MSKPTLNDPAEYKLIKQIYFKNDIIKSEDTDPFEELERIESKQRFNNKSSR